jgi:AbrB family looped-hinge helix DNA binding protein
MELQARSQIGEKGRIVIPTENREALGTVDGEVLDLSVVDGELRVATMRERIRRAQERVRHLAPPGTLVSEELCAERREAARTE